MSSKYLYPFGKEKGKTLDQVAKSSLVFYVKSLKLGNPQYDEKNISMAKECLTLLNVSDIMKIVEEIDPKHSAWEMANDAMNAKMDRKGHLKPASAKTAVVSGSREHNVKSLLKELGTQIKAIYDAALEAQSTIDVFVEKDGMETRSTEEPPY